MQDGRFWRGVAVLAVAGVFYVGHGLHEAGAFADQRVAGEPAPHGIGFGFGVSGAYSPYTDGQPAAAVTCSADGREIYFWSQASANRTERPTQRLSITSMAGASQGVPPPLDTNIRQEPQAPGRRMIPLTSPRR